MSTKEITEVRPEAPDRHEVRLLGGHPVEIPEWVTQAPGIMMGELLAVADASGDAALVAEVRDQPSKGHAPR
jgi:hypothetical protein